MFLRCRDSQLWVFYGYAFDELDQLRLVTDEVLVIPHPSTRGACFKTREPLQYGVKESRETMSGMIIIFMRDVTTQKFQLGTYPDTQLSVEGAKATLLVEKMRSNICHEYIRVVNGEGVALRHPVMIRIYKDD